MVIASEGPTAEMGASLPEHGDGVDAPELRYFVFALFFIFGGITSLNDVILPKLKELFTLNYTQAMLVQFCFFTAYLVIGIPGSQLVKKIGYMRGAVVGLLTMMTGCVVEPRPSALVAYFGYGDIDGPWLTNPSQHYRSTVPLVIIGDAVHTFVDGVVIAAATLTSIPLGITTAAGFSTGVSSMKHAPSS